jgi:hypothetical protein
MANVNSKEIELNRIAFLALVLYFASLVDAANWGDLKVRSFCEHEDFVAATKCFDEFLQISTESSKKGKKFEHLDSL